MSSAFHRSVTVIGLTFRFGNAYTWDQIDTLLVATKRLADKYNVTQSAIALNWVISKGAIPLGGARNAQQAEQNAKATTFRLTPEEVNELTELSFEGAT